MERFIAGDVVVARFPFSNLRSYKHRPALVLANGDFGDVILCQITSFSDGVLQTIALNEQSFASGSLPAASFVRPDKLFTTDTELIQRKAGHLKPESMQTIKQRLVELFDL